MRQGPGAVVWGVVLATAFLAACGEAAAGEPPRPELGTSEAELHARCAAGATRWVRQSTGAGDALAHDVAVTWTGDAVVVGHYEDAGTTAFGPFVLPAGTPGQRNGFVVALRPDGSVRWALGLASTAPEDAERNTSVDAVAVDAAGRITVAGTVGAGVALGGTALPAGAVVLQLRPDGGLRWVRGLGGGRFSFPPELATGPHGDVVLAGSIEGAADFGGGGRPAAPEAAFLARYTRDGAWQWDRVFDAPSSAFRDVAVGENGRVYAVGFFSVEGDFGGGTLTSAAPGESPVVAAYSRTGAHRWSRTLGPAQEGGAFLGVDVRGPRLLVAGHYQGAFSFAGTDFPSSLGRTGLVLAFRTDGAERWGRLAGRNAVDLALDAVGGATVMGTYEDGDVVGDAPLAGTPGGLGDVFLARLSAHDGGSDWVRGIPDVADASDVIGGLDVSWWGDALAAGTFVAPVDFGTGVRTPAGYDAFVLRACR